MKMQKKSSVNTHKAFLIIISDSFSDHGAVTDISADISVHSFRFLHFLCLTGAEKQVFSF